MSNEPISDPSASASGERPEHGARLLVRLTKADPAHADYGLSLETTAATWEGRASVRELDGQVETAPWEATEPPPAWHVQATHALQRSAWQRRRAGHPWPRRLARWRPSPDEADA
jgi:hypothetical protein